MRLHSAAWTDVGKRRQDNEDCHAVVPDLGLYLVADGMGGHKGGRVASRLACEEAVRAVGVLDDSSGSLVERLREAVTRANREVFEAARHDPELSGMGTTFVGMMFDTQRLALAHVGDSRAYVLRGGRLRPLSDDHSVVGEMLRRHEITEEDAREHPHRHVLTRALGVGATVDPQLAEMTPLPDDLFILCSDGLTSHIRDDEIEKRVRDARDLATAARDLVDAANHAGGLDNITVVLIRCLADASDPKRS